MASTLNLGNVKTPGVYIDEMSLFPPSVAQVDTAIPAFIGPTAICPLDKVGVPVRIGSMAEYRSYYGGSMDSTIAVNVDSQGALKSVNTTPGGYLYDSVQLYFANGGEKCYIVSVLHTSADTGELYPKALTALEKFDEPTLIVIPDAVRLDAATMRSVQQAALSHCRKMQDRFAILDVYMDPTSIPADVTTLFDAPTTGFRNNVTQDLNYGAAYFPYLRTSLPLTTSYRKLSFATDLKDIVETANKDTVNKLNALKVDRETVKNFIGTAFPALTAGTGPAMAQVVQTKLTSFATTPPTLTASGLNTEYTTFTDTTKNDSYKAVKQRVDKMVTESTDGSATNDPTPAQVQDMYSEVIRFANGFLGQIDAKLQAGEADLVRQSPIYARIISAINAQGLVLPPSGAIAGVYARTDAERGVWKSPANTGLNYVTGPVVALTDAEQSSMNVDPTAGKSINAIRAFSGKGTLVWGARTLAGSDNEWRYVSVRRFFLMAEESIRKATAQFVFEANDANTWVRVRAMIENFLTLQWRAGALAGAKANQAFFVRVGLGQTMTPQDVLNGFMIIEIGMAAVRPAEFIVLRFSHKMQEA